MSVCRVSEMNRDRRAEQAVFYVFYEAGEIPSASSSHVGHDRTSVTTQIS